MSWLCKNNYVSYTSDISCRDTIFGIDVIVSVYYSLLWHATTLVSFIYTWSVLPTKLYWLLYSDWSTSYLIIPNHSRLLLLLNHTVIVVKLCCVEGLMEDRCTSNKHSR